MVFFFICWDCPSRYVTHRFRLVMTDRVIQFNANLVLTFVGIYGCTENAAQNPEVFFVEFFISNWFERGKLACGNSKYLMCCCQ